MVLLHCTTTPKEGPTQPKADSTLIPGLQHGFEQSPINIITTATEEGHHTIYLYFQDSIKAIENKGHTVQLDFKEGSTLIQDDTTFEFKQCHFHTPSEHLLDGKGFPLEMHIVNIMPSTDSIPQYLVIGILFKEGKRNAFIDDFLQAIPKQAHQTKDLPPGQVSFQDLVDSIPHELKGKFYHYRGSLTTPPYTETVRWYVAKHIFEASKEQIEALHAIEGSNARQVQGLYGRKIDEK